MANELMLTAGWVTHCAWSGNERLISIFSSGAKEQALKLSSSTPGWLSALCLRAGRHPELYDGTYCVCVRAVMIL